MTKQATSRAIICSLWTVFTIVQVGTCRKLFVFSSKWGSKAFSWWRKYTAGINILLALWYWVVMILFSVKIHSNSQSDPFIKCKKTTLQNISWKIQMFMLFAPLCLILMHVITTEWQYNQAEGFARFLEDFASQIISVDDEVGVGSYTLVATDQCYIMLITKKLFLRLNV